ncbi:MAG TPA: hypothetical protein VFT30_05750, partial [Nitrospira sp.]|nr:hypothetical protein [Nitrospira sp.]
GVPVQLKLESELPWNGKVLIHVRPEATSQFTIHLRKPSSEGLSPSGEQTASGYDPRSADYETITRIWSAEGETLEFKFDTSIRLCRAHPKVKGHAGKVAITRGPLVYCLESVDQPHLDIFSVQLDPSSLREEYMTDLLGGCVVIEGKTTDGRPLKFIPYFMWGNRGESQMTVWIHGTL